MKFARAISVVNNSPVDDVRTGARMGADPDRSANLGTRKFFAERLFTMNGAHPLLTAVGDRRHGDGQRRYTINMLEAGGTMSANSSQSGAALSVLGSRMVRLIETHSEQLARGAVERVENSERCQDFIRRCRPRNCSSASRKFTSTSENG